MVEEGLQLPHFDDALSLLKRLNATALSAEHALIEFLDLLGGMKYLPTGIQEIYENTYLDLPLYPVDGAKEILEEFSFTHQLALVTLGKQEFQLAKLKKAGIDSTLFSRIVVGEEKNKKPHYQAILTDFMVEPSRILVCGDRVPIDLTPAKELGFKTIHLRWGRGLHLTDPKGDVDFTITRLGEMRKIVAELAQY
jgi:FMN phosphatase YigB (HAD superfamily)